MRKRLGDGGEDQRRVADGSEIDEDDAVGEVQRQVGSDLQGQAGLADTAGTGERQHAHRRDPPVPRTLQRPHAPDRSAA